MKQMTRRSSVLPLLVLLATLGSPVPAQDANEKAQRYYESLLKRPAPGAVFDRFYTAWLDTQTVDELEAWLQAMANAPDAPPGARLLLAFFYSRQNEHLKAIAQFRLAVEKEGTAEAWFQKAVAEARTLDFDAALSSLTKAAELNPPAVLLNQVRQMQGRWLARNGKPDEAMKVWQALIEASPEDEELREDLIELQISEGLHDHALATAQALLERTTDAYRKVQRRMRIGDIHQRTGNRDKAVETWLLCLEETGADSWMEKELLSQVELAFRKDDALDALKAEFRKLAAKNPQRVSMRRRFAQLLAETGETDAAIDEFTKILELTPGSRETRETFVDLLVQAKRSEAAAAQMQELVRLNPADIELLVKLADLHFAMSQPDACRRAVDEFLARSDQSEASWLRAAGLLDRYKLADASLELFRQAAEKFPDSETSRDALAVSLHKSGKQEEARAAWRSLAANAGKTRVMNVARSAAAREEHELAFELLTARLGDFGMDSLFLFQLCDTAQRVEKFADAVPWARTLVGLSRDAVELENSLTLLMRTASRAEQLDALLGELKTSAQTPQEKCLLAELLDNRGDPKASDAALREVEAAAPELAVATMVRLQIQRGDPAGAAESMKRLVESPGGRKGAHVQRLVELYERAGKSKDALTWIPEWKKLSPGSNLPWQKEAALHFQSGNNKQALQTLRQASREFAENEDLKAMLAAAFKEEGKLADAERLYTVLYEDAEALSDRIRWAGQLAEVAQAAGKSADIIEMFEERRRTNRTSLLPLLALAEIYRVTENYEGRRRALAEAARLKENDLDLLLEIARIAEAEEDYPHALETLKKAEPLDKSGKVRQRIARLQFSSGDETGGMASLRQIAGGNFDPRQAEAIAETLCDQELWKLAVEFLHPLLAKHPDDYRLHYLSGMAMEESGQAPEAARKFQQILMMQKELPSQSAASSPPAVSTLRDSTEAMRAFVPAATLDIVRTSTLSWQAYYHRQSRSRAAGRQQIRMPGSVEDCRAMSLVHLASMGQDLNDTEKAALITSLRAQGVKSVELLMDMMQGDRMNQQVDFETHLEMSPDDEVLLSLAALWGGRRNANYTGPSLDLHVYRKLKDRRPELSWLAGLRLGKLEDEDARSACAETVAALEKLDNPPLMVLSAAIESLSTMDDGAEGLPEESRNLANRLRAKLPGWYRRADPGSAQAHWAFITIATQLSKEDDLRPLVQLFEEEAAAAANDPARNSRNPYFSRRANALLEPLTFPPQRLADYPVAVLGMLNGSGVSYYGRQMELDPDRLKGALPAVSDPVLRVLLTARTDDTDATERLLAEMTAPAGPPLNAILLHAAWLASQEKFEEAAAMLQKAQSMPMTKDIRKMVDSSPVAWAVEAGGQPELANDSPLLAAARESALRMRRDALTPAHRGELAGAMEQLGLTNEADRLAATGPLAAPSSASRSMALSRSLNLSSTRLALNITGGRVDQLIQKGRRDEALKELTRQLKAHAKMWIAGTGDVRYQTREWMETVSRHSLAKPLMEALQPAPDASAEAITQWAAVQDILGETRKALDSYRRALELKPKDAGLRQAYMTSLITEDPATATVELKSYEPRLALSLAGNLLNIMQRTETNAGRMKLLEFFVSLLQQSPAEELAKANLDPILQAVQQAVQSSWGSNEPDIGSLYHIRTAPEEKGDPDPHVQSIRARRMELHQMVTGLLMKSPGTARRAFELHAGVALSNDPKAAADELDRLALEALEAEGKSRAGISGSASAQRNLNGRSGETPIRMPSPETYLVERAWEQKRPGLVTDGLLQRLRVLSRRAQAKKIEESLPLYFSPDAEFSAAATAFLKSQSRSAVPGTFQEHWMTVIHVMELRNLDFDLAGAIADGLKSGSGGAYGSNGFAHVTACALHLQKTKGPEAVRALFARVAEFSLGPIEKRADLIAKHFNPSSYSSNTPNGMMMQWIQFLRSTWSNENLILAAAESYTSEFLRYGREHVKQDQLFQYSHRLDDSSFYQRDAAKVVEFFRGSRLTAALPDFMAFSSPLSQRCLAVDVLQAILQADKRKLREAFAAEPGTFGTELIDLVFEKNSVAEAALAMFASRLDDIKKLELPRQQDLAGMIQVASSRTSLPDNKMNDAMRAAKEWSEEVALGGTAGRVARLLEMKSLRGQQNQGDYQFSQSLTPLLISLAGTQPDEAVKVFLKVRALFAGARRSGMTSGISFGDNTSVLGGVLYSVLAGSAQRAKTNAASSANLLSFVLRSTLPCEGFPVEWKPGVHDQLAELLRNLGTLPDQPGAGLPGTAPGGTDGTQIPGSNELSKFSVHRLLPRLATVPGLHPGALLGASRALFAGKEPVCNADDLKWLESKSSGGESSEIAAVLLAGQRLAKPDDRKNISDAAALPAEQQKLLEFINDAGITAPVRLSAAADILSNPGLIGPPVRCAAAALLSEGWKQTVPVSERQSGHIVKALTELHTDLAAEPPENIRIAAGDLLRSWQRAASRRATTGTYGYRFSGGDGLSGPGAAELALLSGDETLLRQFLTTSSGLAGRAWLSRLVKARRFEVAHLLLQSGNESIYSDPGPNADNAWTPDLAEAAVEFIAGLPTDEEKCLAGALIASLPDNRDSANGSVKTAGQPRMDRLNAIAARLPETFSSPEVHERVLGILIGGKASHPSLASSLAAWAANQTFGSISLVGSQPVRQRRGTLLAAHLKNRMKEGDLTAIQDAISQIASASSSQQSSSWLSDAARPTLTLWHEESPALTGSTDPVVRRAARGIRHELAFAADSQNVLENLSPGRTLRALFHDALDDDVAAFSAAAAELPEAIRKRMAREIESVTVEALEPFKKILPDNKAETAVARSRIVLRIMDNSLAWLADFPAEPRTLRTLIEHGWLIRDDALKAAESLMQRHPRDGRTAQEFAMLFADAGKPDDALASLKKAAALIPDGSRTAEVSLAMTRCSVLESLDRIDDALAALESIPEAALDAREAGPGLKPRFIAARTRVEQAAAWRSGGASAVAAIAAKRLEADPGSTDARQGVSDAFTMVAGKLEAAGDKIAACHYREAAFLITEKLAGDDPKNQQEALVRAAKALTGARLAMGGQGPLDAVPRNATWRYAVGVQDFKTWMEPGYTDSAWKSGEAPLGTGVGDGVIKTQTSIPEVMGLRTTFSLKDPVNVQSARLEIMRGDGAVIYLNGREIHRSNVPEGGISESTRAENMVSHLEAVEWRPVRLTRDKLGGLKADNVLSAVLFQYNSESTGLTFGLSLRINDPEPQELSKSIDKPAMVKALDGVWMQLPESFRKHVLQD